MYARQVKRKCSVRGCKNAKCYAISQTREAGNTVIICKDCLSDALDSIEKIAPGEKTNIPKQSNTPPPPLFFNGAIDKVQTEKKEPKPRTVKNEKKNRSDEK